MQILVDLQTLTGGAAIPPQAFAASGNGVSINMQNGGVYTGALLEVGAVVGTVTTLSVAVQEWSGNTNDSSTWANIAGLVFANVTTSGRQVLAAIRQQGFVRGIVQTMTGTTTVSVPLCLEVLDMPRSSGQGTGFSNSPAG